MKRLYDRGQGRWFGKDRAENSKVDFSDFPEVVENTLRVRLEIFQNGVQTGFDHGILGFDEDALFFSGAQSSFRLYARDLVQENWMISWDIEHAQSVLENNGLQVRHPSREVRILIRIVPPGGSGQWFLKRLQRFKENNGEGESQLPPLRVHPILLKPSAEARLLGISVSFRLVICVLFLSQLILRERYLNLALIFTFFTIHGLISWYQAHRERSQRTQIDRSELASEGLSP